MSFWKKAWNGVRSAVGAIGSVASAVTKDIPVVGGLVQGATNAIDSLGIAGPQTDAKHMNAQNLQAQQSFLNQQLSFNSSEAQKNRDFQVQQTNLANEYNSPVNQVNRLDQAGLNPNLAYGDLGSSTMTPASGSMASGSLASVPQMNLDSLADFRLKSSQANLLDEEARDRSNYNRVGKEIYSGLVKLQNLQLELGDWTKKLSSAQFNETYKKIELINSQLDMNKAAWATMEADLATARSRADFADRLNQAELDFKISAANLNNEQAKHVATFASAALKSALASAAQAESLSAYYDQLTRDAAVSANISEAVQDFTKNFIMTTSKQAEFMFGKMESYQDLIICSEIARNIGNAFGSILGGFGSLKNPAKPGVSSSYQPYSSTTTW